TFEHPPIKNDATAEAIAFRSLANTGRALDLLLRYTATARRAFDAALKTLRDLQRERRKSELQNEPDSAKPRAKSMASAPPAQANTAASTRLAPVLSMPPAPHQPRPDDSQPVPECDIDDASPGRLSGKIHG
ncbi:MAG TPA: hypothetical protein VER03_07020, partial [Bryobacteraceae bacterium]|nr:hypothetical protein [Bryobacteraceae bacterium]